MAKPRGVEHLQNYFKDLTDDYVLIGGGAATILMESHGLEFRATKDIDIVLLTNSSTKLNDRLIQYIQEGKYEIKETFPEKARYFRFRKPENKKFPEIIEIFARNEHNIELKDGQYIIPIQNDAKAKISAILLDDEYFNIVRSNRIKSENGESIINAVANICLKARAYRDLSLRKSNSEEIDAKDIAKHKRDILRLAVTLQGNERVELGHQATSDIKYILSDLETMDQKQFKTIMEHFPDINKADLLGLLTSIFIN